MAFHYLIWSHFLQNNLEDLYSLLCFLHVEPWCNSNWYGFIRPLYSYICCWKFQNPYSWVVLFSLGGRSWFRDLMRMVTRGDWNLSKLFLGRSCWGGPRKQRTRWESMHFLALSFLDVLNCKNRLSCLLPHRIMLTTWFQCWFQSHIGAPTGSYWGCGMWTIYRGTWFLWCAFQEIKGMYLCFKFFCLVTKKR